MRHGALQYLVKPFAFAGLRGKLEAYARLRRTLDGGGEAEQAEVDRIFGALSESTEPQLPKGRSPPRRTWCGGRWRAAEGPLSAHEPAAVAHQFGDQEQHHQPGHEEAHRSRASRRSRRGQ
ncbi:hypothetical protein SALBM217S_04260 [Streptomyces griseoloalbus]